MIEPLALSPFCGESQEAEDFYDLAAKAESEICTGYRQLQATSK